MDDFNERINRLVERHEALTVSIELHDHQIEALIKEQQRTARELRLFQRYVLMMGLRMDERISNLEQGDGGEEPSAA